MDPRAISKAHSRLRLVEKSITELELCKSHQEFEEAWYTFLVAAKNVYTTLEQGAKVSPQARQWFGGKKQQRKDDPLLQYLFQARDDDEHGLEPVTKHQPGNIKIGVSKPGYASGIMGGSILIQNGNVTMRDVQSTDGKPILVEVEPAHSQLAPVTGRGNIIYPPPTEHMGHKLESNLPIPVAKLALSYLKALVSEAEGIA
jgi:hypothetical protein